MLHKIKNLLYRYFIRPKSRNKDVARREFVLNILLLCLIFLSSSAFLINLFYILYLRNEYHGSSPLVTLGTSIFFVILLILSRKGYNRISGVLLIVLLYITTIDITLKSGADNPQLAFINSLIIIMAGVLFGTRYIVGIVGLVLVGVLIGSYLQSHNILMPPFSWRLDAFSFGDGVFYGVSLALIAIITWLYNSEIGKSLKRARESEKALMRERDLLEIKVEERTRELRKIQAEKLRQVQKFAEFGKHSSILLHDLATPLNLVSLNLESIGNQVSKKDLVRLKDSLNRAIQGTRLMEEYLSVAKSQLRVKDENIHFSVEEEISKAIHMIKFKAKKNHVQIRFQKKSEIKLHGNPMQFNHILINLLSNAIDSYEGTGGIDNRKIVVSCREEEGECMLSVRDWGCGIKEENKEKIFVPLFTTKNSEKGTGIGLSICRDIITDSFKGEISFTSAEGKGSTFIAQFPLNIHG